MAVSQAKMANSLRDIATLLEREEVRPALLKEVGEFINKFPWAEFSTCPEDKLSRCPPEIMEQILQYLPPRDLKSAVLVNKTLCGVGGKPKFWGDVKVSLQSLESGVSFMESSREISCLEASSLSSEESVELLAAMSDVSTFKEVSLHGCHVEQIQPKVLSKVLSNLVKVDFENSSLTEQQLATLFSSMASGCKISSLSLREINLSTVALEMIWSASKLLEVNLSETLMTNEQTRVFWEGL